MHPGADPGAGYSGAWSSLSVGITWARSSALPATPVERRSAMIRSSMSSTRPARSPGAWPWSASSSGATGSTLSSRSGLTVVPSRTSARRPACPVRGSALAAGGGKNQTRGFASPRRPLRVRPHGRRPLMRRGRNAPLGASLPRQRGMAPRDPAHSDGAGSGLIPVQGGDVAAGDGDGVVGAPSSLRRV